MSCHSSVVKKRELACATAHVETGAGPAVCVVDSSASACPPERQWLLVLGQAFTKLLATNHRGTGLKFKLHVAATWQAQKPGRMPEEVTTVLLHLEWQVELFD